MFIQYEMDIDRKPVSLLDVPDDTTNKVREDTMVGEERVRQELHCERDFLRPCLQLVRFGRSDHKWMRLNTTFELVHFQTLFFRTSVTFSLLFII